DDRLERRIGIEASVVGVSHVGQPAERWRGAGGKILGIGRIDGAADELVVLLLGDVDQSGESAAGGAVVEGGVEIAIDVVVAGVAVAVEREGEAGIAASGGEAGGAGVAVTVVVPDEVSA